MENKKHNHHQSFHPFWEIGDLILNQTQQAYSGAVSVCPGLHFQVSSQIKSRLEKTEGEKR
jgi:hypothetical protein